MLKDPIRGLSLVTALLCAGTFTAHINAQGNVIAAAGYTIPAPVSAAPGQILTFFVQGLTISLPAPVRAPSGAALPGSLAGISATLRQGTTEMATPLVEVRAVSTCPSGGAAGLSSVSCAALTAVTLQIPYELVPLCPLCLRPVSFPPPWLYISYNGQAGSAIELNPLSDQVHVLSNCDVMLLPASSPLPNNITGLPCPPMVTHANGTLVSASSPANIGETLTAWVTGLGFTNPAALTGQPPAKALPTAETFTIGYNYTPNALPAKPGLGGPVRPPATVSYSGLVAGFTGLYQINFVVPPEPGSGTPQCALTGTYAPGTNVAQSNLTVSFGGGFSFGGAGICVLTHIPVD